MNIKEKIWHRFYENGTVAIAYACDSYITQQLKLNKLYESELTCIAQFAYEQSLNKIQEYFQAHPSDLTFPLFIQEEDVKTYLAIKRLRNSK